MTLGPSKRVMYLQTAERVGKHFKLMGLRLTKYVPSIYHFICPWGSRLSFHPRPPHNVPKHPHRLSGSTLLYWAAD